MLLQKISKAIGLDINSRSSVLQDVAWSTAVQHGPTNNIFETALAGKDVSKLSDAEIIKLVYAERGRRDSDGNLRHFRGSSRAEQEDVSDRFVSEEREALEQLSAIKK